MCTTEPGKPKFLNLISYLFLPSCLPLSLIYLCIVCMYVCIFMSVCPCFSYPPSPLPSLPSFLPVLFSPSFLTLGQGLISPNWSSIHYVAQDNFELLILLLPPSKCCSYRYQSWSSVYLVPGPLVCQTLTVPTEPCPWLHFLSLLSCTLLSSHDFMYPQMNPPFGRTVPTGLLAGCSRPTLIFVFKFCI